ncbi:MAG: response regulator [Bacteroidota bacterium]|jgi:DNA-binding response OmpR family regulator|nr:response regulator [Bacteroidota bacterium]
MKRVLIVDDNNDILWVVGLILKKYGFDVITTLKGEEVLAKTKTFSPQLILLDVFLSGIDGIEVCNQLKSAPETKDIPVIMFSAHTDFKELKKFCKADDFVSKPFDAGELVQKINSQIEAHHY